MYIFLSFDAPRMNSGKFFSIFSKYGKICNYNTTFGLAISTFRVNLKWVKFLLKKKDNKYEV